MTPNTSPKKPAWFALIENNSPSAQVRKVDKKLPAATAIVALAIVAFGTFFASGSMNFDSSPTSNLANASLSSTTSQATASQPVTSQPVVKANQVASQSINKIADPTLNGGGDDDDDDDDEEDDGDYEEDDDDRD
jgi:hypothetical protein